MSTDFIKTLKQEHQTIRDLFDSIDATRNLENIKNLIQKLQAVLAIHLRKEDTELYPTLMKSSDEEVRRMASIFHVTMEAYAEKFAMVVNKILSIEGGEVPSGIMADYENIRDRMKDRVTIEEVSIFPVYEKSI